MKLSINMRSFDDFHPLKKNLLSMFWNQNTQVMDPGSITHQLYGFGQVT